MCVHRFNAQYNFSVFESTHTSVSLHPVNTDYWSVHVHLKSVLVADVWTRRLFVPSTVVRYLHSANSDPANRIYCHFLATKSLRVTTSPNFSTKHVAAPPSGVNGHEPRLLTSHMSL